MKCAPQSPIIISIWSSEMSIYLSIYLLILISVKSEAGLLRKGERVNNNKEYMYIRVRLGPVNGNFCIRKSFLNIQVNVQRIVPSVEWIIIWQGKP